MAPAYKMYPVDVYEAHSEVDPRDFYTPDERHVILETLEEQHQESVLKGVDWVLENGYPWVEYSSRAAQMRDVAEIRALVSRYNQHVTMFGGMERRSGKSLCAIARGAQFYRIGFEIISNIGLHMGYRMDSGGDLLHLARSAPYWLWILDEVHQALGKWGQSTKFAQGATGALASLGKQRSMLFGITSQEDELGINILKEVRWAVYPQQPRGPIQQTDYWQKIWCIEIGPKPYPRDFTLADQYHLPRMGGKVKKWKWIPGEGQLLEAAALYGSYAEIPTRAQAGSELKAAQVAKIDLDHSVQIIDVPPGSRTLEDADVPVVESADVEKEAWQCLWDCWKTIKADDLTGTIDIALLLARVRVVQGQDYRQDEAEHWMAQACGARAGKVRRLGFELLYKDSNVNTEL